MTPKYWESMAEREKNDISVTRPEKAKNAVSLGLSTESTKTLYNTSAGNNEKNNPDLAVGNAGNINTASAAGKNGAVDEVAIENKNTTDSEQTQEKTGKTNLPRPLAKFFGGVLTGFSSIGISVLMALLIIITVGCAVLALAFMAGGGFTVFEAFANIKSATIVALQYMGIGFAVFALGLLLMLATIKLIRSALPGTAGLFPKAVHSCMSL